MKKLNEIFLITLFMTFFMSYTNTSLADTLTPPKILSVDQGFDSSEQFKTGDVLAFTARFSFDSYGLKNLSIDFSSQNECVRWNINLGPGGVNGNLSKGVLDDPKLDSSGRLVGNSFTFFGELKSSCFVGANNFTVRVRISDFSNLSASYERNFKVDVVNGLAKRPGESRGPDQALEVVDYSQLFIGKRLQGSTLEIVLPSFSKEGVSLIWGTRGGGGGSAMCQIPYKKLSPENFSQILVIRDSNPNNPYCELWFSSDLSDLDLYSSANGSLDFYLLKGELVTASKYRQMQIADQNKKSITCVKGNQVKKIIGINPKCPSGYKKR